MESFLLARMRMLSAAVRHVRTEKGVFIEKMAEHVEAFKEFMGSNILILDGAMGTQIQQRGLALGQVPETFNIERA